MILRSIIARLLTGLLLALLAVPLTAAENTWLTDLPKAQEQARTEKKLVLLNFTGSDWCIGCKEWHNEVFPSRVFTEFARKHLVLVEVDFPERKKQSNELKKANEALKERFKVDGYPTLVLLNSEGKEVGRTDYTAQSPKALVAELEKMRAKRSR